MLAGKERGFAPCSPLRVWANFGDYFMNEKITKVSSPRDEKWVISKKKEKKGEGHRGILEVYLVTSVSWAKLSVTRCLVSRVSRKVSPRCGPLFVLGSVFAAAAVTS